MPAVTDDTSSERRLSVRQSRQRPKPLWQHGFDWLDDAINTSIPHAFDVQRMYRLAKGMHMVGERPPFEEVKAYLAQLWPPWSLTQRRVGEIWRTVLRHPHRRYRRIRSSDEPLYVVDLLIERHGLQPVTEERVAAATREALEGYLIAAPQLDIEAWREARRALDGALNAVERLRRLRFGPTALGDRWPLEGDPRGRAKRPRWW